MYIDFNEFSKSQRSDFINGIWSINQILKNAFLSIYLDSNGNVISDKLNKLETGIHSAHCSLHDYLMVPQGKQLRIDCNKIYTLIKDYKSLLEGILYEDDNVYFMVKDVGKAIIAKIVEPKGVENNVGIKIYNREILASFSENDIQIMTDKKIIEKNVEGYKMILAHKLFPNLKKSDNNLIRVVDCEDGCFISTFEFTYLAANSSGKKVYSEVTMYHKYKFIKF